jgi:signal peptidase II
MSKKSRISYLPLIITGIVLALDIVSKYFVQEYIEPMDGYSLWYPYNGIGVFRNFLGIEFSITHATNRGAAWGILAEYQNYLLIFRIFMVGLIINYLLFFNKIKKIVIPLSLIAAGALGNIIDYFLYGHVVDMFHFVFWGYDYPVFNIADASIFIGILWIFLLTVFKVK